MHFLILCGSHRKNSQSARVGEYLKQQLLAPPEQTCELLDLSENPLPLWNEAFFSTAGAQKEGWLSIKKKLQESDGLVVITPEYNGMASPQLKNFFLFPSRTELGHKPALLVGVSASRSGSYPIAELRSFSYKNNRLVYLPEHLIIRDVAEMLNETTTEGEAARYLRERIAYTLKVLTLYAATLKPLRKNPFLFENDFPNGM